MRATAAVLLTVGALALIVVRVGPAGADPYYLASDASHCHGGGSYPATFDQTCSLRVLDTEWDFAIDPWMGAEMRICHNKERALAGRAADRWNNAVIRCPKRYLLSVPTEALSEPNLQCADNSELALSRIVLVENYTNPTSQYHWLYTSGAWTTGTMATAHVTWDPDHPTHTTQAAIYVNAEDYYIDAGCLPNLPCGDKSDGNRTLDPMNLEYVLLHEFGHVMGLGHADATSDIMTAYYVHALACTRVASGITDADKTALVNLNANGCTDDPVTASARVHGSTAYIHVGGVPAGTQGLSVVFRDAIRDGREYNRVEVPCGRGAPAVQSEWVRWNHAARPDSIVGVRRDGRIFWLPLEVINENP